MMKKLFFLVLTLWCGVLLSGVAAQECESLNCDACRNGDVNALDAGTRCTAVGLISDCASSI